MSGSSRHKEKYRNNSNVTLVHCSDGTSARTRPFNFEDIMLRRKNKKTGEIQVASVEAGNWEHNIEHVIDRMENDVDRHDSIHIASRSLSEDFMRVRSRRKEENTYTVNEGKAASNRYGKSRDPEAKSNSLIPNLSHNDATGSKSDRHVHKRKRGDRAIEHSKDESGERHLRGLSLKERSGENVNLKSVIEREYKQGINYDDKRIHSRRRDVHQSGHDYENESKKKHSGIHKYADAGRGKSEKESKRKHHDEGKERIGDRDGVRKHDKHISKNSDSVERKEKDTSRGHYEEVRLKRKRKRSRSREHDRDKSRRPLSVSPRAQKCISDQGYSSIDKSERSHINAERKRISSNGPNNNHKRYSESSSGLGGYSPRKRKTEAAAKTPSPTTRFLERRTAGWDYPPAQKEPDINSSLVSYVKLSSQTASENGPNSSSVMPLTLVAVEPIGISQYTPSSQTHAIDSIQLTQATRPMRRLYVENIPSSASEKAVVECINNFLLSSGVNHIEGTLPCISCMINKEKSQALLEFLTPEDASAALSFDGRSFFGSMLKIRRPKDFVEVTTGVHDKSVDTTNGISDHVEDSSHKIFIGRISKIISSEMLMEIAGAFGSLKAFHFEQNVDVDAQYAFLEYADHLVTQKACACLNGMKLGGQVLTVLKAFPDDPILGNDNGRPFYGIPEHANPLLKNPTAVLKLKNLLDPERITSLSDAEVEEILEDIRLECARFGSVKTINVVKHMDDSTNGEALAAVDGSSSSINYKDNLEEVGVESTTSKELVENDTLKPFSNSMEAVVVDETAKCDTISDEKLSISNQHFGTFRKPGDANKITISDGHADDKLVGNILSDETSESPSDCKDPTKKGAACQEILDMTSGECTELHTLPGQLESNTKISDISPVGAHEMDSEVNIAQRSKLEEDIGGLNAIEPDFYGKKELDVPDRIENKEEIQNLHDSFEAGCILVEFRRAEASCMAAHCLHGRLFDDCIVTIEYVDPDIYHKRFPK